MNCRVDDGCCLFCSTKLIGPKENCLLFCGFLGASWVINYPGLMLIGRCSGDDVMCQFSRTTTSLVSPGCLGCPLMSFYAGINGTKV